MYTAELFLLPLITAARLWIRDANGGTLTIAASGSCSVEYSRLRPWVLLNGTCELCHASSLSVLDALTPSQLS